MIKVPDNCITITTYAELREFATKWYAGQLGLLVIMSSGGAGKTQTIRNIINDPTFEIVDGHTRAFGFYEHCFNHIDEPIVIDDADTLWADPILRPLLKKLCDTDERAAKRILRWKTKAADQAGIPRQFATSSRVCVLCNGWETAQAISDRAILLHFNPSAAEMHKEAGKWFKDAEVYFLQARMLKDFRRN